MITELTISADEAAVETARRLAAGHNTTLSAMFVRFTRALAWVEENGTNQQIAPLTAKMSGLISLSGDRSMNGPLEDALLQKYGLDS